MSHQEIIERYANITPEEFEALPEEEKQAVCEAILPIIRSIVDVLVPILNAAMEAVKNLWNSVLHTYPDKRIVWLAFHHKKERVKKKNRHRIAKWLSQRKLS